MKYQIIVNDLVEAFNSKDVELFLKYFKSDAHVFDRGEKKDITGISSIRRWFDETNSSFDFQTELHSSEEIVQGFRFNALVKGDFQGSPITFCYEGIVNNGKVLRLDISIGKR